MVVHTLEVRVMVVRALMREQVAVFWNSSDGCAYIGSIEMCGHVAVFWNLSYGDENNWPNDPRPHGCFRNRKWKIECNPHGRNGGFGGTWPVCQNW